MSSHQQYSQQQRGAPQSSGGYGENSPAHYQQQQQQPQPPPEAYGDQHQQYREQRRSTGRDEEEQNRRRRSRSSNHRSSSSNRRGGEGSSSSQQQPPPPQSSDQYPDQSSNQFHYPGGALANNVTPPSQDAASSSNLAQSSTLDGTQRRPAYLLHRDLVIGKGSYGQVCIASRGEAEGHHSNKSGKRKKFACKCVMLRNDPKYIAKLQEEVNVLRELRGHDNVIRLFDVFCVDNELFIITELGRGGDLFHLLTTHPKHGVTEAYAGKCLGVVCVA